MLYAIVVMIALILDQLLKYWTTINIVLETGRKPLIPGFIHLSNVHNYGAAFSFLQGGRWFFVALCIAFVAAIIYLLAKNIIFTTPGTRWAAVIVLAGAAGNCIDRVIDGYVVDMLEFDFKIFGRAFPVFNLADIFIVVGAIVFCIFLLVEKPESAQAPSSATSDRQAAASRVPTAPPSAPEWEDGEEAGDEAAEPAVPAPTQEPAGAPPAGVVVYTQPAAAVPPQQPAPVEEPQEPPREPPKPAAPSPAVEPRAASPEAADRQAEPAETKTEQVMRMLVNGAQPGAMSDPPATQEEPRPQQEPDPQPEPDGGGVRYNLDDILAEFRDL